MTRNVNHQPVPVLLTEGLKYALPRETFLRNVPLLGNKLPIGAYLAKADERKKAGEITTDIDFLGNSALTLTSDLHTLMLLGGGWDSQIEALVSQVGKSLFNSHGFFSAEALKTGQSSLGPRIAGEKFAVEGLLQEKHFLTVSDLLSVFEKDGDEVRTQRQKRMDILISLGTGGALATLGEAGLLLQGEIMKTVAANASQQSLMTGAEVGGGVVGGVVAGIVGKIGVEVGNAISRRVLHGEDLPHVVQTYAPLITALMGMMGGKEIVQKFFETSQVPVGALDSYWWLPPAVGVGGAIAAGKISKKVHEREQDAITDEIERIKKSGRANMLLSMANSMTVLKKLKKWGDRIETTDVNGPRQARVTAALQAWDPEVTAALADYNPRNPASQEKIRQLAPGNLLKLSERLFIMDTLAEYLPPATVKRGRGGGIEPNVVATGVIPGPDKLFGNLDRDTLRTLGDETGNFIKQLATKSPLSALSAFSPTLSLVMLGQGLDTKGGIGAGDDTRHYAFGGMNFGIRADIVDMVFASLSKLGTIRDPGRAHITAKIKSLGALYKQAVPIEGLELIYKEPPYARLAVMGSIAYAKAQETKTFEGDLTALEKREQELLGIPKRRRAENRELENVQTQLRAIRKNESEMGTKGLLSDVGDAIINSMKEDGEPKGNELTGYLVLADITNAIKMYSSQDLFPVLGPVDKGVRKETVKALKSLREGIVQRLLSQSIPQSQPDLFKFFTDGDYAVKAYTTLTMCQEVCTDYAQDGSVEYDTVDALMKTYGLTLSPIFELDDLQIDPLTGESSNNIVNRERIKGPMGRTNSGRVGELDDAQTAALIDMIHLSGMHQDSPTHRKLGELLHREFLPSLMVDYVRKISPGGGNGHYTADMMKNAEGFMPYAFRTVHNYDLPALAIMLADVLDNFAKSANMRFGGVQTQVGSLGGVSEDYLRMITAVDLGQAVLNARANDLGGVIENAGGPVTTGVLTTAVIAPTIATRIHRAIEAIEDKFGTMLASAAMVRTTVQNLPVVSQVGPS